jgi:hypothetical protein
MSNLKSYLARLEACLGSLPSNARQAVMEELRGHLEDRAAALRADGLQKEASMNEAIERFGEAREVGTALRDVHGPSSWAETVAGMIPFLLHPIFFVFGSVMVSLVKDWSPPEPVVLTISSALALIYAGAVMTVLGTSWVKGFPRWCYPYWALGLAFSALLVGAATPGLRIFGHTFGRNELWGWRAWIPVLVVAMVALLLSRSVRPLRQLVVGIWHDWTRLSFGFYGFLPLALMIVFDEVHGEEPYVAVLGVILAIGALAYMRSSRTWQRALTLLLGMTLTWTAATVYLAIYWHGRQEFWMREPGTGYETARGMLIALGVLVALMLAPALLGLLRRSVQSMRAA